jgi:hypothetical protein
LFILKPFMFWMKYKIFLEYFNLKKRILIYVQRFNLKRTDGVSFKLVQYLKITLNIIPAGIWTQIYGVKTHCPNP